MSGSGSGAAAVRFWEGTGDLAVLVPWAREVAAGVPGAQVLTSPDQPYDRLVLLLPFADRQQAESFREPEVATVRGHAWVFDVA